MEITIQKIIDESSGSELEVTGSTMFSSTLLTVQTKIMNAVKIRPEKWRPHMKYEKPIMVWVCPEERKAWRTNTTCETSTKRKIRESL